ncbi:MAG: HDIG domain-containing protein [Puniceicoccales bacterium]|jgi:putative nucleotidyltransferase with HDIG domain|nr:HDIG domain-containing protein [Puniceicoccales bacterium]
MARVKQPKHNHFYYRNIRGSHHGIASETRMLIVYFFWLLLLTAVISTVCFTWNDYLNVQFIPGNLSKTKIIAEVPFEFESKERTKKLYEQRKNQACNVYTIDEGKYDNFIKMLKLLDERMEGLSYEDFLSERGRNEIREFINEFNAMGSIKVEWQDIAMIISSLSQIERTQIFQECVSILREIARNGVCFDDLSGGTFGKPFKIKGKQHKRVLTQEEAFYHSRVHLLSLDLDRDMVNTLFKILKQGIKPNLVYDAEESKIDINIITRSIKPVIVKHNVGDVILEKNDVIDQEKYEDFIEYQHALRASHRSGRLSYYMFFEKAFLTFIVVTMSFIGLKLFAPNIRIFQEKRYYVLSVLVVLQLAILRIWIQFGELEILVKNSTLIYALYCMAPFLVASTIGTLFLGLADGLIISIVVSVLYTFMLARSMDFCLVVLVTCLALIMSLRNTSSRFKIFACSFSAGLVFAASIIIHGIFTQLSAKIMFCQVAATFIMSTVTSVITVIFIPIFEKVFAIYTDISLLKLSDYRNPLLQRLQFVAPGTYQHSLSVSILSEQVARSIGANKIICKTGALFHDLGKVAMPEYFIENQNKYVNPHNQQPPFISSLIIRNHVREGVSLARAAKLPKIIVDIILEHHGTTVTQFFYDKARGELLEGIDVVSTTSKDIENYLRGKLDKNGFRYDGPRPLSKESAIVMLADSIEAASRSMKKVTHQSIENLVDEIFENKIQDHQLEECPITLDELKVLKKAFLFTMTHVFHSRVSYSKVKTDAKVDESERN